MEILEVLRDLKLRVRARDVEKKCSAMVSAANSTDTAGMIHTPAPVYLVIDAIEPDTSVPDPQDLISTTTSKIVADTTTATSCVSVWPHVSRDTYNTARPKRLYTLLVTTTATLPYNTINATVDQPETITGPFEPADYSLEDIEEILWKIGKRYQNNMVPIPESIQENAEAL
jgi:hypothetical protein